MSVAARNASLRKRLAAAWGCAQQLVETFLLSEENRQLREQHIRALSYAATLRSRTTANTSDHH